MVIRFAVAAKVKLWFLLSDTVYWLVGLVRGRMCGGICVTIRKSHFRNFYKLRASCAGGNTYTWKMVWPGAIITTTGATFALRA